MRITRNQLQDLINEEISRALLKAQNRRLLESVGESSPVPMDTLIRFAKLYTKISPTDRSNLNLLIQGHGESVTPGEIDDLKVLFRGFSSALDEFLEEALEASAMHDDDDDDGSWAAAVRANR